MATCPECDNPLDLEEDAIAESETLECDECGAELEVISLHPIELRAIKSEGYDEEETSYDEG